MDTFTAQQRAYLASQRLGRLATVDRTGTPQNSPVGFTITDEGTVVIVGWTMGDSRKFHNVVGHPRAAFVVDDITSVDPWQVRGVEIRGQAEAVFDVEPAQAGLSREQIHLLPERIISWGLDDPTAA